MIDRKKLDSYTHIINTDNFILMPIITTNCPVNLEGLPQKGGAVSREKNMNHADKTMWARTDFQQLTTTGK